MEEIRIKIELVEKGCMLYIGTIDASGYKKLCKNRQEVNREIKAYINGYIDYAEQFNKKGGKKMKKYEIEYWKWHNGSGWSYNSTVDNIETDNIDGAMDELAGVWFDDQSNDGDKITASIYADDGTKTIVAARVCDK